MTKDIFDLAEQNPNKYHLTVSKIKKLIITDWNKLKTLTWHNIAMDRTGTWWCHLEGCQGENESFNDEDEFCIGFREEDNKIDCSFSAYGGMCSYKFEQFYNMKDIENIFDARVQINTIRWLNKLIDEGILALPEIKEEKDND